jgi:transcriptional regulator with XRE-family HTH domain
MVTAMSQALTSSLAASLSEARLAQGLSVSALAERSGVSRAMIAKVERAEAQPTAVLLGRLSAALGMTLSELVARAEQDDRRLVRAADQPRWADPETGYERRAISPASGGPLELIEIELPAGARVSYPAESYTFIHQQIWVLQGRLAFREGTEEHDLRAGDCLQLGAPAACTFHNPGARPCRYLVALTRRRA